jgi:hypothetical protein
VVDHHPIVSTVGRVLGDRPHFLEREMTNREDCVSFDDFVEAYTDVVFQLSALCERIEAVFPPILRRITPVYAELFSESATPRRVMFCVHRGRPDDLRAEVQRRLHHERVEPAVAVVQHDATDGRSFVRIWEQTVDVRDTVDRREEVFLEYDSVHSDLCGVARTLVPVCRSGDKRRTAVCMHIHGALQEAGVVAGSHVIWYQSGDSSIHRF